MNGGHRSDRELMDRICARDDSAFEELYARYHETMVSHLMRMLRDPHAAEDLAQEVFLRIWTRSEQWSGSGPIRAWATQIATNLALNYIRSVRRRREQPLDIASEEADWDAHRLSGASSRVAYRGPQQALEDLEWREQLQQNILRLSEEKRTVFCLAHGAEMDVREIAHRLGIPQGTVRSRLHYARRQLARDLAADLADDTFCKMEEQ